MTNGRTLTPAEERDQRVQRHLLLLREKWSMEDELINHRMTWLLVSQGLLFSAFAALFYAKATALAPLIQQPSCTSVCADVKPQIEKLVSDLGDAILLVPVVGIMVSLTIWVSIFAAAEAGASGSTPMSPIMRRSTPRAMFIH